MVSPVSSPADTETDGRTRHYGDFYGLTEPPVAEFTLLVMGNCQAESLRIMLDGADVRTVRTPAVHEIVASDLPFLDAWLARCDILISQPIRDDYHSLPIGTAQLAERMPRGARIARVPVIRFAGLYPAHVIVRPPSDPSLTPPIVEYHDLRLLLEARARREGTTAPALTLDAATVLAIGAASVGELHRREVAPDTVRVSDLFDCPSFEQMRTLNHPGNSVWRSVAERSRRMLGLAEHVVDPGRPLLDSIHAPREQDVIDTFALDAEATDHWRVGDRIVSTAEVRDAHLDWYARHPDAVDAGLVRHAATLTLFGIA